MYAAETAVCEDFLRLGTDYVYVSNTLGTQSSISEYLNDNIETARNLIAIHSEECLEQVFRLLCFYYLPPCGNATHLQSPSSICQEECLHVQETCSATWEAVTLAFTRLEPVLNCSDTSNIIFPLPNCCTGAGVQFSSSTGEHT